MYIVFVFVLLLFLRAVLRSLPVFRNRTFKDLRQKVLTAR